jgi:lipoate-protein ligase A
MLAPSGSSPPEPAPLIEDQVLSLPAGLAELDRTEPTIAGNLALDEALLVAAEDRGAAPVLRFWEPTGLAVVLGASSRLREDVDLPACLADGIQIARRSSGGGTVVIGPGTLNVTVVLPADAAPALRAVDTAQAFVLGRIARALRRLGPPVEVRGLGDLTLGDRKFAGSAQRRLRRHVMIHLSLLYSFPVEPIVRYTRLPRRQPAYRAGRPHESFLTNLNLPRATVLDAIRGAWVSTAPTPVPAIVPEDLLDELVRDKFGDPVWVERL